ncbi:MAG: trypsin-like peptidase domain-containing protein [Spirochaetales bacterium]|uniref:Trypsin-like peptidase domain-containing protein n=1 Tax=Candidatus Thalassospirochaeta sargassi TaxID=3119039 RepID=A0AAJ1ID13_9SPIO|nr:trypsin-like peptidase domain-containing protein [Spirochaetales bacterium]
MLIFSCATDTDAVREIPEYSEAFIDKINEYIDAGEYGRAISLCRTVEDERIAKLEKKAVAGIHKALAVAIVEKKFIEAAEFLKSLDAAGAEHEYNLAEIYISSIEKALDDDAEALALAVFQRDIINRDSDYSMTAETESLLFDASLENRNEIVLDYLLERNSELSENREDEIAAARKTPEKNEMISGTVTVWIDRGIKLEGGLGYPDRVIGSGFYIDRRGYVLTNYHVISSEVDPEYEGFSRLYIKYDKNEEKIPATVVGWDESLDIALLKAAITPEYIYNFPELREYKPGESIFAIGSPGGLDKTITSGIISATGDRRLLPLGDTIQVDVPINSGNSGGPVVDEDGKLVGVVFAGIEQFEGVNFIIPVKWIMNSLSELYVEGRNRQSWLGLSVHESNDGLEIIYVMPGTSGFIAGVGAGDRIVSIGGRAAEEITDAQEVMLSYRPGTLVNLVVERDEEELEFLLIAEERKNMPMKKALQLDSRKNLMAPFLGMAVERGNEDVMGQQYIIKRVYRGMSADETGLSVDDPFSIVNWEVDEKNGVIYAGIRIKKRKAGFLETAIQLGSYIDINNTI